MVRELAAELVLDAGAELGEGPGWDAAARYLVWVDILAGQVCFFDPEESQSTAAGGQVLEVGQHVGAAVPRAGGGLALALRGGFATMEITTGDLTLLAAVGDGDGRTRMNDGKCDAGGRFWAGTMDYEEKDPIGCLYRLDPEGTVTTALRGVTVSNGLGWSPDGATMYYIDSPTYRVDALPFDPDSGELGPRRPLVTLEEPGMPDGLCVDDEGCLWVASFGGSRVDRFTPDGRLDTVVNVPAAQVTSCAFGGADGGDLFITTARVGLSEPELAAQPGAGGIFRCRPGVTGRPATPFAG